MKIVTRTASALALSAGLAVCGLTMTATSALADVFVSQSRIVPGPDAGTATVYMVLKNTSREDEVLMSASSPAATQITIYQGLRKGGETVATPTTNGLTIPAKRTLRLTPDGHYMTLSGVTGLQPGASVPIDLDFGTIPSKTIDVPVE
ncbi:copper chaperone PCu(A)C [Pseudooceanicola algae]|uniref:Copper chaperone PCu(A)C n=1 Tax=Pseudooceanicola algae TaxID=1537215 RepID=A0A418SI00_9RHOB|nr:copper chaperone PCu(A)C [Pseudooceanicola algae]QPM92110.1 hypothetical protein PSAL_033730 [Pseudooceanicola algae]